MPNSSNRCTNICANSERGHLHQTNGVSVEVVTQLDCIRMVKPHLDNTTTFLPSNGTLNSRLKAKRIQLATRPLRVDSKSLTSKTRYREMQPSETPNNTHPEAASVSGIAKKMLRSVDYLSFIGDRSSAPSTPSAVSVITLVHDYAHANSDDSCVLSQRQRVAILHEKPIYARDAEKNSSASQPWQHCQLLKKHPATC